MPPYTSYSALLLALLLGLGLLATGCQRGEPDAAAGPQIAFNDYEAVMGWLGSTQSVTRERAHSGSHAVKVDGGMEYGLGYGLELSQVADHPLRKLHLEAWGFMTDLQSTAQLGLQLYDPVQRKPVFGESIDYATAVQTPGKWVKISKDITLPASTSSTQQLRVFLWRGSASSPAYVDDLRISEVP